MTSPLDPTILTMVVTTANGVVREHVLDLGTGKRSVILERMQARVAAIEESMERKEALTMENPTVTYNFALVESVGYEVQGASEVTQQIREAMADAARPLGFGRPIRGVSEAPKI